MTNTLTYKREPNICSGRKIHLTDPGKAWMYDKYKNEWAEGLAARIVADSTLVEGKRVYSFPLEYTEGAADARDAFCYGLPLGLALFRFRDEISGFHALMQLPLEERQKITERPWEDFVYSTRRCTEVSFDRQSMDERVSTLARLGYDAVSVYHYEEPGKTVRAFDWTEIERSFRGMPDREPLATLIYRTKEAGDVLFRPTEDVDMYRFVGNPRDALVGIMRFDVKE